jgi:23S rRNA (guanosine2251-2'-O)-methyltransferase
MKKTTSPLQKKSDYWLYGKHACYAALNNPDRKIKKILVCAKNISPPLQGTHPSPTPCSARDIEEKLPPHSVHQGIAVLTEPLKPLSIYDIIPEGPIIALDQISDPHNLGAILRSAAAFNAKAILTTSDNAVSENATAAKIACGALETIPIIEITNLARTLDELKKHQYWCIGLDHKAPAPLHKTDLPTPLVLVLGAEGKGLRPLVAKKCDLTAFLPMSEHIESLNVSNAAAIALYELYKNA